MERINHVTADPNANGSGKSGFAGGDIGTQRPATVLTPAWANNLQEEIALAIEGSGLVLDPANKAQLLRALRIRAHRHALSNTIRRTPASSYSGTIRGIALNQHALPIICGDSAMVQDTPDGGETWAGVAVAGGYGGTFHAIMRANTLVVVGSSGEIQAGSPLTKRTQAGAYAGTFYGCTWRSLGGGSRLNVIVGTSGEIQTSADETTWTKRTQAGAFAGDFRDVCANSALIVAVGTSGEIQTSPDGITWTKRTPGSGFAGMFSGVARGLTHWVAVGDTGQVQRSADGITWASVGDIAFGATLHDVAFDGTAFVAVGASGSLFVSYDEGATWESGFLGYSPTALPTLWAVSKDHVYPNVSTRPFAMVAGASGLIRQGLRTPL